MDSKYATTSDTEGQLSARQIAIISACGLIAAFAIATFDDQVVLNAQQTPGMSVLEKGLSGDLARVSGGHERRL